jgi:hypothetical protein
MESEWEEKDKKRDRQQSGHAMQDDSILAKQLQSDV